VTDEEEERSSFSLLSAEMLSSLSLSFSILMRWVLNIAAFIILNDNRSSLDRLFS